MRWHTILPEAANPPPDVATPTGANPARVKMTLPRRPTPIVSPRCPITGSSAPRSADRWLTLRAPAKLNLFLEVHSKREDGFHELETVMAPLRLADRLWLRPRSDGDIWLSLRGPFAAGVPTDERNLVVRALRGLNQRVEGSYGADVVVEKNVPAEAGMGGGSSDAAAALMLANRAWQLDLGDGELPPLAAEIGSDVPFFLDGGAAVCRGRGEQVESLPVPAGCACVVMKPPHGLSTAAVYAELATQPTSKPVVAVDSMIQPLVAGDWRSVAQNLFNRLQRPAFHLAGSIRAVAASLDQVSATGWLMTGSGSAMFKLAPNHRVAQRIAVLVRHRNLGWAAATSIA